MRFLNSNAGFFNTAEEFISHHEKMTVNDWLTQLEWVANGTYGAGACFVLRDTWDRIKENNRVDKPAHIGAVLLRAMTGKRFTWWRKLPAPMQEAITQACQAWVDSEGKEFAV